MKIDLQTFGRKKLICSFFALIFMSALNQGQRHEVGVQLVMSNLVGDIGRTDYILQKPFRNDAIFEYNFLPVNDEQQSSGSIDYGVIDENIVQVSYNKDILTPGSTTKSAVQDAPYRAEAEARVANFIQNRFIGNINSKDWVNVMTLDMSYSFGRPPGYCGE